MANTYLSEGQINRCAGICNQVFSKENKAKLKEIGKKYGLVFDQDKQTNTNLLFRVLEDKLKLNTSITWGAYTKETYAQRIKGGWSFDTQYIWGQWMEQNPEYKQDYSFILSFNPESVLDTIFNEMGESHIDYGNFSLNELYYVDNYQSFFSDKYGIHILLDKIDKKARKDAERVINFFDNLLEGIPHKSNVFNALNTYYINGDKDQFYIKLFLNK